MIATAITTANASNTTMITAILIPIAAEVASESFSLSSLLPGFTT